MAGPSREIAAAIAEQAAGAGIELVASLPDGVWSDDLWDLVLLASQCQEVVERAAATLEQ